MATQTPGQLIDQSRSEIAIQIEAISHMLTVWFMSHKGCSDEIEQYNAAIDHMHDLAGDDSEVASYLHYTLARDWFRSLYGHNWEGAK
jgi:hypothetical protein